MEQENIVLNKISREVFNSLTQEAKETNNYLILEENGKTTVHIGALSEIYDTGWIKITDFGLNFQSYENMDVYCRKYGKVVQVTGACETLAALSSDNFASYIMFTLPNGFQPAYEIRQICQGSGNCIWLLTVDINGVVRFSRYRAGSMNETTTAPDGSHNGTWLPFDFTFITN